MKYRLTPFNLLSVLLIIYGIYMAFDPGPMGFGLLGAYFLIPAGIGFILLDFIGQKSLPSFRSLIILELAIVLMIAFGLMYRERTKTFIIPENANFEYITIVYGMDDQEKLPVHFFKWRYQIPIPDNGIILTSTRLKSDLPKTIIYRNVDGISKGKKSYLAPVHKDKIQVNTSEYDYQVWKFDDSGSITYSSDDVLNLKKTLHKYLSENIID